MYLAIVENAGFCGVAFVTDSPCDFKAKDMLFAFFVIDIVSTASPVPDELVRCIDLAPVEGAERLVLGEFIGVIAIGESTACRHTILLSGHKVLGVIALKGKDGCDIFKTLGDIHTEVTLEDFAFVYHLKVDSTLGFHSVEIVNCVALFTCESAGTVNSV